MAKRLPMTLQIKHAKNLFCDLNPPCDAIDEVDFKHAMDKNLSYAENISELEGSYPEYRWQTPEEITPKRYEALVIEDIKTQIEPMSYAVVKSRQLAVLERQSRKLGRTEKALSVCKVERDKPRPSPPGVCEIKSVKVRSYKRCLPRR